MKPKTAIILVLFTQAYFTPSCRAVDLEQGTFSIGGTSNLLFFQEDWSDVNKSYDLNFNTEAGYFFLKNLEFGIDSWIAFNILSDWNKSFSLTPFINYHFSLSKKKNIYLRLGAAYSYSESEVDTFASKIHSNGIICKLGDVYFFTDKIAIDFGIQAGRYWEKERWDAAVTDSGNGGYKNASNSIRNTLTALFKFKYYF